jgi:putative hydrolases of HD superfamily
MKALLGLFIKIGKLKTNKRKGWNLYKLKQPSTTADHLFRAAVLAWALNKERGLEEGEVIKMSLIHHLPDILIGEQTPYDGLLPENLSQKKANNILQKLPQLSLIAERKRDKKRQAQEEKAFRELIKRLPKDFKKEIEALWQEYSFQRSKKAKFVQQAGKLESYLQALEYWKKQGKLNQKIWTHWAKQHLKESIVWNFRKEIDKFFLKSKKKCNSNRMCAILNFLIEVGKLKETKRRGWVLRGIKDAETVAQHTYQMTIMAWAIGSLKGLDTDRIVKIALAHDLCEVYAGDSTPYDPIVASGDDIRTMFDKAPRVEYKKRLEWLLEKKNKEWKSLVKLTSHLPKKLQEEIVTLWIDFEEGFSKEGRFVYQVDKLVNLIQAIEYWKKDKKFPINPWWVFIRERIDDPMLLKFLKELDNYHSKLKRKK